MSGRPALVPALAAVALLLTAGLAAAHTGSPSVSAMAPLATAPATPASPEAIAAAPAAPGFPWPFLLLVALAPAFARRRSLKLAGATLVLVLAVFAFEAAFHSVHHGFGREAACPTASAAAHVAGTTVGLVALDAPALPAGPALLDPGFVLPHPGPLSPHQGRAPPSTLV